jgi:RNA polymerase sigma-70 factor (ECF subfamily)
LSVVLESEGIGALDELTLARAAAQGNEEAFELLVNRYRSYIYTVAYNIALHEEDALDITQNVFLKLVEQIGSYAGRGSFRSWLAAITTRESINHQRRPSGREISTEPKILAEVIEASDNHSSPTPAARIEIENRRRLVEGAMGKLSPQQRAIFTLLLVEEMKLKDVAEELGIPAKQASWQLHRALATIREELADEIG